MIDDRIVKKILLSGIKLNTSKGNKNNKNNDYNFKNWYNINYHTYGSIFAYPHYNQSSVSRCFGFNSYLISSTFNNKPRRGGSDFTTQAVLGSVTSRPTNNFVTANSFYDVVFVTATAGVIKTIEVTFPAGTTIPSALVNEVVGIGPGTPSKSGQTTIVYTIANVVNVPAGTKIRLEIANINIPLNPSTSYKVTVTIRDAANAIIDGPT